MITLYGAGPMFGLPDPSPFVMKTMVQLKQAGLDFRLERARPPEGPKGKIPFLRDGDTLVADSHFIRQHIERRYRVDLDHGLSTAERAEAWVLERMLEDHLYFLLIRWRWLDDANFAKGPIQFFAGAPESMIEAARDRVGATLHSQGLGRHCDEELNEIGARTLSALSVCLGDKPFMMGERQSGVDASAFGMLAGLLTPLFDSPLRRQAESHANLVAYSARMMAQHFPDWRAQAA